MDTSNKNPFFHTKTFWYRQFQMDLVSGNNAQAEQNFLRYRYWLRRERLWNYLEQLCKQKEFGNAG